MSRYPPSGMPVAAFPDEERARGRAELLQRQATNGTVHGVEHDPSKEPYAFHVIAYERSAGPVPKPGDRLPAGRRVVFLAELRRRGRGRPRKREQSWFEGAG